MKSIGEDHFFVVLDKEIEEQYSAPLAAQLSAFSRRVFDFAALEELRQVLGKELVGTALRFLQDFLEFVQKIDLGKPKVQARLPSLGSYFGGTEIFIIQRDMSFVVDSICIELNRRGVNIQAISSTVLNVTRDADDRVISTFADPDATTSCKEVFIFLSVEFDGSKQELQVLVDSIVDVLRDVEIVTNDFPLMVQRLDQAIDEVITNYADLSNQEVAELVHFLQWMRDEAFVFLGCSEFELSNREGTLVLKRHSGRQLGIFAHHPIDKPEIALDNLNPNLRKFYNGTCLAFTKSSQRARVHRQAYPDYIVLKRYDSKGNVVGEHLFMGLYTSKVYTISPFQMPLIRHRVQQVLDRINFPKGSHNYKAICQLIEIHPRDELFNCSVDELYQVLISIWQMNERRMVRFIMRTDPFEKFISCLVYMPKETYTTVIRQKIEALLRFELDASECEFNTYFSESILARIQFVLRINSNAYLQTNHRELEQRIVQLTQNWCDRLFEDAIDKWGERVGRVMMKRYGQAFPASYQDHFDPMVAVSDIDLFHSLSSDSEIAMYLHQREEDQNHIMHFRLFRLINPLELSSIVPMLENLGFCVLGEHPYEITPSKGDVVWLHDFTLACNLDVDVDVSLVRETFQHAFNAVWLGNTENDSFNHLVVGARLDWRTVSLFRLYSRYMKQLGSNFSQDFIAATLVTNFGITRNLVAIFHCLLDPKIVGQSREEYGRADRLNEKIIEALDQVSNLNEDKVIRSYLQLFNATKRTNFFQIDAVNKTNHSENKIDTKGKYKAYVSVKLATQELDDAPVPRPLYEIFVYSPRMEGVHLRMGKVARGGLRWSDRLEDYRTEVLGLVKAQQVKNAVIVPTGAKGGFVSKLIARKATRTEFLQEGLACYQLFIAGLLDITDNIVEEQLIAPNCVVCRDGEDPYLVVAADKGTATYSDIANKIASERNFWLGDAFASGGSHGYDHKKMGITARGAWISVQRHFAEKGINTQTDVITVVGIGDMAGDVFGNGLLRSEHIKLVAAFNHQHIFIDPNPDTAVSFLERKRLFELPSSTWEDYDTTLLSEGGGVFLRSAKSIKLSPQALQCLGIDQVSLSPTDLIHRLLSAKVDLIWNGGIGTYVKSSGENNIDVGDRANDSVRVNGKDLQCRVFGEGGNLGMTQKGRIEFALNGGACNTDFIDNSAGVDCSDHEVNIKILLNNIVRNGEMTFEQRNHMLEDMTANVAELVLHNNYQQNQAISLAHYSCQREFSDYYRFISESESAGQLNRELESLPDDEVLAERKKLSLGLTRPELSILLSYGKMLLKEAVLSSDLPENPYITKAVYGAFPTQLVEKFSRQIECHSLYREIITNQIVNEVINVMGLTFYQRQVASTGASVSEIVTAYVVVRDVLGLDQAWKQVESLGYKVPSKVQFELFHALMRLGRRASRWILRNRRSCLDLQQAVAAFKPKLVRLQLLLPTLFSRRDSSDWNDEVDRIVAEGAQKNVAVLVASSNFLYFGFGIADIAISSEKPVDLVLELYACISSVLDLDWFADKIISLEPSTRWEDFARESYVDDLESQRRSLAYSLLSNITSVAEIDRVVDTWKVDQSLLIIRWSAMITELKVDNSSDFAMISVALSELMDIVQATKVSVS